ncbi:MAG: hypothetical protein UY76_C0057G0005 [Candidatus Uhrbacteria bacterium GW2011_GWA2_52_8d]|uniref:Uncharacterized protein n=1 Tax=Candidatus Uhrbacteria bacterium GW2011_GWA2_52_8d TaxID=1618979 RepID=A0A0G1XJS1_9BACT|nr:MAG: hypothetical protein UY76_C0057G0005 [Candidatus Uhrbacteria bacterium GW2011_GWA2_52_8d]
MSSQHSSLAAGRWQQFTLAEQLGHVGSEVSRTRKAFGDEQRYWSAATRAFELLDLTIEDSRWQPRLRELLRVREVLADAVLGGSEYKSSLEDVDKYFLSFARAAQAGR